MNQKRISIRSVLHTLFRWLWFLTLALVLSVGVYLLAARILSSISTDPEPGSAADVQIFLRTNGVHTDVVLPVRTAAIDWSQDLLFSHTLSRDTTEKFIGIGWGDKGFYLDTPTWSELSFGTAFHAVFGLGHAAMHTTYFYDIHESDSCVQLHLSAAQYYRLISYIQSSFAHDRQGKVMSIHTTAHYCDTDAFYEAAGTYSMFHTCNSWTNDALKSCGQRACLWTPFQSGIFRQYSMKMQ